MVRGTHLKVQGVVKRFGQLDVLKGMDLEIQPGEFVVVVGKSGSGKSTLLRLIAGLETADEGGLVVDGVPLNGPNLLSRVMFQDARLLPWKNAIDNVRIGLKRAQFGAADEALAHVGLGNRAKAWVSLLSGGERQRVALARALVSKPLLLLLDEPLGALDALTRIEMQGLIERLWQEEGFSALLITHDVDEAVALADRVVLIENGVIGLNVAVHLPRPRDRGSAAFAALKGEILNRVLGIRFTGTETEVPEYHLPLYEKALS
ncbi:MAG: ATP-binding cassette domain-containing protein [bacterium]|nr:ATP-binding cassette domain-containing protein [bacterium]